MAELDDRMEREAKLALLLSRVGAAQRRELEKMLGNPPNIKNVPAAWWAKSQQEIEDTLTKVLLLTFAASAMGHGLGRMLAEKRAAAWAATNSAKIAKQMTTNTRIGLGMSLRDIMDRGGVPTRADIRGVTVRWLGPTRFIGVAITETTRAQHNGGEFGIESTIGLSPEDEWITRSDGHVCPVCLPFHLKPRKVWARSFPDGPPEPHRSCRCWIRYAGSRLLVPSR